MIFGLHTSTGGNLAAAPLRAAEKGAQAMQIFASNPRSWRPTLYSDQQASDFRTACQTAGIKQTFMHMIYLTSYGTLNEDVRSKSTIALTQALETADQLGVAGVVTHLGSHRDQTIEAAIERVIEALKSTMATSQHSYLIVENAAGSGHVIGDTIEELAAIIKGVGDPRVRLCLDTAHLLASGYDIRKPDEWDRLLASVDQQIGWEKVAVLHLNDSKIDLGGRVDRHQNIGDGFIGDEGFKVILSHPRLQGSDLAGILEVPGLDGKGPDAANLERLRQLA